MCDIHLFTYFWLCWVSIAVQAFSLLLQSLWLQHGFSRVAVPGLLIAMTSPVAECGSWGAQASVPGAPRLQSTGSVVVVHRLSCSTACGTFPDQGSIKDI